MQVRGSRTPGERHCSSTIYWYKCRAQRASCHNQICWNPKKAAVDKLARKIPTIYVKC
ncbi:hypothetical protein Mapa_014591 [Marchantia paleacea]|nr:hypothetical protein Mapa_014591 [Marchantia paleacea]